MKDKINYFVGYYGKRVAGDHLFLVNHGRDKYGLEKTTSFTREKAIAKAEELYASHDGQYKVIAYNNRKPSDLLIVIEAVVTKVKFLVSEDGEAIALFPEIKADSNPDNCLSYMIVGQHGAASKALNWRKAELSEYQLLQSHLEYRGYNLEIL